MPAAQRLALAAVIVGLVIGLLVLGAAWAAGRRHKTLFWMGGTAWGILLSWLILTDCIRPIGHGPLGDIALTIYFGGLVIWPVGLAWGQPRWWLRWLLAQLVMLLTLAPAFLVAIVSALCSFT